MRQVVNRPAAVDIVGTSEPADVISLSGAAHMIATDMMISIERHAMPQRRARTFDEDDFTDGNAGLRCSATDHRNLRGP
ncbi:hypothetical protein [Actinophytocola sp.]|uniref:hypothetical protein n=1 Tax=Actinophytocola sp. TaxID=1872138 RepID=UPI002EDAF73F